MHSTYVRMQMERQRANAGRRMVARPPYHVAVRTQVKNCCRNTVAFLFTQVGVIGLIVAYTLVGAFVFIELESRTNRLPLLLREGHQRRARYVDLLWNTTHHLNVLHYEKWRHDVNVTLLNYQKEVVLHVKRGYDATDRADSGWSFPAAIMYCITVYTTIGYGNLTPKTGYGKLATVLYALLGIPLMLLYMSNVGEVLATSFKYTHNKMCRCRRRNATEAAVTVESSPAEDPETVSVTSCLLVMLVFVVGGAILFSAWEGWDYVDGSYFCFTSLLTIGFGDFVPGNTIKQEASRRSTNGTSTQSYDYDVDGKLILCAVYLLLGMALLAMCVNLMQEEVIMKIKRFGRRVGLLRQRN